MEQRQEPIRLLETDATLDPAWAPIIFPTEKREYELVYHGKEREEDIIASALAVPLQKVRTFGRNGIDWDNKLIFGDNLQVMKTLLELKRSGQLCNADGVPGVRLVGGRSLSTKPVQSRVGWESRCRPVASRRYGGREPW